MSVYLNSTPQEDGNLLNGGVAMHNESADPAYNVFEYSIVAFRDAPQYLEFAAGGQFVGIWDSYGTYLASGDTGFTFRWKIWARGLGTFALTQDTDPSWSTAALPTTSIGTLNVDSGGGSGYGLYHVPAGPIDLTAFLGFDAIRLGLNLTSGAVDITTIQLECVPDGAPLGWWRNETTPVNDAEFTATARMYDNLANVSADQATRQDAWDAAYALLVAGQPTGETDPTTLGLQSLGTTVSIGGSLGGVPSWAAIGPNVVPADTFKATFVMGVAKMWVETAVDSPPVLDGTEGVNYIRIPGYVTYDGAKAYARSAGSHGNLPDRHVDWIDPHAVWTSDNTSYAAGDFEDMNLNVWFTIVNEATRPTDDPVAWGGGSGSSASKTLFPLPTTSSEVTTVSLPSSGRVVVYGFASAVDGGTATKPVLPSDADGGVFFQGSVTLQSSADTGSAHTLRYTLHYDAYSVWDPTLSPPGQLKLRMPDSTWRILGNPDDTGGRLKIETPDATVWKEYRTVDGAVTAHPVKLFTDGGWIEVMRMTPD